MHLDLDRLDRGRLRTVFQIGPDHYVLRGYDLEVRDPLRLEVELENPGHGTYVLSADLEGTVHGSCRRCLTPLSVEIDERFRIVYQEETGRDEGSEGGDADFVSIPRDATGIEIDDEIRDRLFLETDRFPVCKEECRGICPVCGQELNLGSCDCSETVVADARWQALRNLVSGSD